MDKKISPVQERDACLALVFLLLLIWFFTQAIWLVYAAMAVLLLGMVWPGAMRPFARLWFGLALVLGKFVSSILLGIVWALFVLPVGYARRLMGKDAMRLKGWKEDDSSRFVERDHQYCADDLKNPY